MEILQLCWDLVQSLAIQSWTLLESLGLFVGGLISTLHVEYPRLEGLIIGVSLAWLLSRRDRHPLLRAASAPLKLVIDILDLAWDQVVEVLGDVWGTAKGWVVGVGSWCKSKVAAAWGWSIASLRSVKDKLSKKKEESE